MNFSLLMFSALMLTGIIWLIDNLVLAKQRVNDQQPHWIVEYAKSFFPVILIVFSLRSFIVEPFKIPSGSMLPTLVIGDYIVVNKFTYGIRLPVLNVKILEINKPERGDVLVFRYPNDPSLDYIKRVVAVAGDKIEYKDKKIYINDQLMPFKYVQDYQYNRGGLNYTIAKRHTELIDKKPHDILTDAESPTFRLDEVKNFKFREQCEYTENSFKCTVPQGNYFVMGDNRDDSNDSRYWGFVPDENVVGKAFLIWFNSSKFERIGQSIN